MATKYDSGFGFEAAITNKISSTGSQFSKGVQIGGLERDFVVQPTTGRSVIFEAKNWEPSEFNINRAHAQVELLRKTDKGIDNFVVIPKKPSFGLPDGVISIDDIPRVIANIKGAG